jgi:hypothetical protein
LQAERRLTHCNAVCFRVVRHVIVPVDGVLAKNESSANGARKLITVRHGSKNLINMIHGWDDCSKVWGAAREEQRCIFEYLAQRSISSKKR